MAQVEPVQNFYFLLGAVFAAFFLCHCTLLALSAPPRFNAGRWSWEARSYV
jgi:hypothetical protein